MTSAAKQKAVDFKLSVVLSGHKSDVRAVLFPDPSFALTASRDGSTRVWKRESTSPVTYDDTESSHSATFKTCLAYIAPSKEYSDGLIISSGQDAVIEARQPSTTSERNADGLMVGHSNQVCSLDSCVEGGWIVSGSWDNTAKIWQIGKWETEVELNGHTATVWAVMAYSRDTIVTGCADRAIRVFDIRGKLKISFDGKDIVRALTKVPEKHPTGAQIASASNDGIVRLWTLHGKLVSELVGHDGFIYSLSTLPSGEIVSSGEDRSVRIWQGTECVQVITIPAISAWSVSTCVNGDLIVGSSDKMARIFTRDRDRMADDETLAQFDESLQQSSIPQQQVGDINMTDLPGPDFLQRKSGTKEGQSQIIKEEDGSATLYQWSMSQQSWVKIGQVVDSAGSNSSKQTYNGKEYDYVFHINIEDDKPALKLPFNVTQNPYEAATKFLQDHELPMTYLEETANFIIKNTQGTTLGQAQPTGADPWGSENRYRPGEVPTSKYQPPRASAKQILPHKDYLPIVLGKPAQAMAQIAKRNNDYSTTGETQMALSSAGIEELTKLSQQLEKHNFQNAASLTWSPISNAGLQALVKVVTQWQPPSNRLAGLDLLRFLAAASKSFPESEDDNIDAVAHVLSSGIFDESAVNSNPKLAMVAIRFFSNLLYGSASGRSIVLEHIDDILESLKPVSIPAATDASVAIAMTTFYLNLAVLITKEGGSDAETKAHRGIGILDETSKFLSLVPAINHSAAASPAGQTTEPAYRALMAIGTIMTGLKRQEVITAARDILNISVILTDLQKKKYAEEPRFKGLVNEIRSALSQ